MKLSEKLERLKEINSKLSSEDVNIDEVAGLVEEGVKLIKESKEGMMKIEKSVNDSLLELESDNDE